jgi:hypothetical protein
MQMSEDLKAQFSTVNTTLIAQDQRVSTLETSVHTVQTKLAEMTNDEAELYSLSVLAATEQALMLSGTYPLSCVLSNWGDTGDAEKNTSISACFAPLKKPGVVKLGDPSGAKLIKQEHEKGFTRLRFESADTAISFKKAWTAKKVKNSTGAPVFCSRDTPKQVRILRAKLIAAERALKQFSYRQELEEATAANRPAVKKQWVTRWDQGGVLYVDTLRIARRTPQGNLHWYDPNWENTYRSLIPPTPTETTPEGPATKRSKHD